MTDRIVLAEDDETTREAVEFKLTSRGWDIVSFENGRDCWEYLETNEPPDLVVLDVMMPGLDGFSVLDRLRNHDRTSEVPVVMLTSRSREEDIVRALESGAYGYVPKPFSEAELMTPIDKVLNEE